MFDEQLLLSRCYYQEDVSMYRWQLMSEGKKELHSKATLHTALGIRSHAVAVQVCRSCLVK
jgi:hypothetical protein